MGCGSSSDAANNDQAAKTRALRKRINWQDIYAKLPCDRAPDSKAKRDKLFQQFDPNNNGYLSLAEIDKGLRDILALDDVFDAKPVIMRAYKAASVLNPKPGKGQDYVEKCEFRMLLLYLRTYMKIWEAFMYADSSDDRRLNRQEFERVVPKLQEWLGITATANELWTKYNSDGGQYVLFTDFAEGTIQPLIAKEDPGAE